MHASGDNLACSGYLSAEQLAEQAGSPSLDPLDRLPADAVNDFMCKPLS